MYGNDTGWAFKAIGPEGSGDDGRFVVTTGALANYGVGLADFWEQPSSAKTKTDIQDARAALDPIDTIRNARARKYRRVWGGPNSPTIFGVIAEELPEVLTRKLVTREGEDAETVIDLGSQIAVVWGAVGQILERQIVATTAVATFNGPLAPGATAEVSCTWQSTPPATPSGGFVQINAPAGLIGRVTAWIKTGSATDGGCVVVFKNVSAVQISAQPITATAVGLGLFTPPYIPEG